MTEKIHVDYVDYMTFSKVNAALNVESAFDEHCRIFDSNDQIPEYVDYLKSWGGNPRVKKINFIFDVEELNQFFEETYWDIDGVPCFVLK